jgi:hypothetical protein
MRRSGSDLLTALDTVLAATPEDTAVVRPLSRKLVADVRDELRRLSAPPKVSDHLAMAVAYADRADAGAVGSALAPYWADMHARIAIAQEVRRVGDLVEQIINMAVQGVLGEVLDSVMGDSPLMEEAPDA